MLGYSGVRRIISHVINIRLISRANKKTAITACMMNSDRRGPNMGFLHENFTLKQ